MLMNCVDELINELGELLVSELIDQLVKFELFVNELINELGDLFICELID